jgi:filamentous hemagglutinin family protein
MKRFFGRYALIAGAFGLCSSGVATGNPTGPTVVSGNAMIHQAGNLTSIINTPGAIINWQSFRIGVNEAANFIRGSGGAAVLNRVTGANPTAILGNLQSNGRVFLINPNGNLFGANTTALKTDVIAPGKSVELSDPASPNVKVEVKAPADRAVNVQQLVDSIGKRDVTSALTFSSGARAATMAVRDEAGRIVLKAVP